MLSKLYLFFFLVIGISACQENKNNQNFKEKLHQKETIILIDKPLKLNIKASKKTARWKEYVNFKEEFDFFLKTTPSDILGNADELNTFAEQLKDSIRISAYKIPAFKARLNVLQNETMRLKDMTTIPNLTKKDIKNQLIKILNAFNATNAKLNNMVIQQQIENEINLLRDSI
ncbi:MAG: hypothetical protein L3J45_07505 [Flavobacteriaceae bacterium]|nr:hypothetical protein [Flavobacteriaceae bacterium]